MTDIPASSSRTSLRLDWVLAGLSVWLIGGFYVDLWAHAHGEVDDTFFTPWHGLLYSGAASFGVVLAIAAILGKPRGVSVRDVLAPAYRVAFLGAVLFVVAGVLDLAWHEVFGFEVDVESLLSPTHLLLATSGLLMVGAPIRSAAARMTGARAGTSWRQAGPFVIPLAMALAVFGAFTQYAHPIVDRWSAALPGSSVHPPAQIFAMAPDGSAQRRLTITDSDARGPRMSPDGTTIVYSLREGDGQQLHVMAADGSGDRALTAEGRNVRPDWSPDGSRIAFASDRDGGLDIYVMNADGSGVARLTDDPAADWAPAWSPDGRLIAFNSDREGSYDLFAVDAGGSNLVPLTSGPANDYEPAWAPEGGLIAFTSDRSGPFGIWQVEPDGLEVTALGVGPGDNYMPAWAPDGSRLAFTSNRTGDFEVFVVSRDGGEAQNVSRNPGADDGWDTIDWTPSGAQLLYPSQGVVSAWRDPFIRQGFGAAGILIFSTILAGGLAFARRQGRLPLGTFTVLVATPAAMATVLHDAYQFIPAAVVAGVAADIAAWAWPPGRSRVGDALVAFLVPALFFAFYFATIALTDGLGWSLHLWLGAILLAGVIGLFIDELSRRPARTSEFI
jgi:Tol biopolymer transport system component